MTEPHAAEHAPAPLPETPYVGLVPYREKDARFFFGRDEERRVVAGNLRAYRLTILYGPSGVGKTSLVEAGVIHDLRAQPRASAGGRVDLGPDVVERRPLAICTFRSWRDDPLHGLAAAMRQAVAEATQDADLPVWQQGDPFLETVRAWTSRVRAILVVLDQFEEYFLYHGAEEGEGTFADELPRLVNEPNLRANFLISIREDAWAKLDRFEARIPRLYTNYIRVDHLDRAAARAAITGPIEAWNRLLPPSERPYTIEDGLVAAVLDAADSATESTGGLGGAPVPAGARGGTIEAPFLQLVLERIWRATTAAGERELTLATLERLGGAAQIVESHLLESLGRLTPVEQTAAADLFRFLVTRARTKIAHSTSDLADWTQRPEADVMLVLEKLSAGESGRILRRVPPPDPDHEPMRYELFHDVLAEPILDWRRGYEQERARRAAFRRYARVGGVLLALVLAFAALSVWALVQRSEARRATSSASSLALAATAKAQIDRRLDEGLLLALAGYSASPTAEAADAVVTALERARRSGADTILHSHRRGVRTIAVTRNGDILASAGFDGTIRLWDLRALRPLDPPLRGHRSQIWGVSFTPDGRLLASASLDGTVRLWDVREGRPRGAPLRAHRSPVASVAVSPDGATLASGGDDGAVRLWDVRTRREVATPLEGHDGRIAGIAWSGDGRMLATAGYDATVRLWDVRTRRPLLPPLRAHTRHVLAVAFAPGDRVLASADIDGAIWLWDAASGNRLGQIPNEAGDVWSVAFSADGRTLASSGADGTVRLWDVRTREQLAPPLEGHGARVAGVAFGAGEDKLASSSYDGTVRLWDAPRPALLGGPFAGPGHTGSVEHVAVSTGGRTVASAGADMTVRLWDVAARRAGGTLTAPDAEAFATVAFSPDGRLVAAAGGGGKVRLWNRRSRRPVGAAFGDHQGAVESIAFSADSETLVTAGFDGTLRLWDVETRRPLRPPLEGHDGAVWSVALTADGHTLASAGLDGTVRLWDLAGDGDAEILHRSDRAPSTAPLAVAFGADDRLLGVGSLGAGIQLWDVRARKRVGQPLRGHVERVESIAFSPDGRTLVSGGDDGTVRLWDVRARKSLGPPLRGHAGRVSSVAFAQGGATVVSGGRDGTVRSWEGLLWSDRDDLRDRVCRLVIGSLTRSEWEELAPGIAYRRSCPA